MMLSRGRRAVIGDMLEEGEVGDGPCFVFEVFGVGELEAEGPRLEGFVEGVAGIEVFEARVRKDEFVEVAVSLGEVVDVDTRVEAVFHVVVVGRGLEEEVDGADAEVDGGEAVVEVDALAEELSVVHGDRRRVAAPDVDVADPRPASDVEAAVAFPMDLRHLRRRSGGGAGFFSLVVFVVFFVVERRRGFVVVDVVAVEDVSTGGAGDGEGA
mmetsp:Transcript_28865/g.93040  ORF Transcript_28865/g.93040 Transcript_28865/m.93040 type:complete len:212 (-) Transcript_28865:471-1106(-)